VRRSCRTDLDDAVHLDTWFIDCKHAKHGVPPTELQNLLAWAQAERPDTALIVVSNFLSNPAKIYLDSYRANQRPPFKLEKLAARRVVLLRRHDLVDDPIRRLLPS
jgi:hypothetical protein